MKRSRNEINPEITDVQQRLFEAVCRGELSTVQQCIEFSPNLNFQIDHWSLLFHACHNYSNNPEKMSLIITTLIIAGADINQPNARGSKYIPIKYALSIDASDLLTIICNATKSYCDQNRLEIGKVLFPALRRAICGDIHPKRLKILLESGADPNPSDDSPSLLYEVFVKANKATFISKKIKYLIAHGLSYEKQILYTQLKEICWDYVQAEERVDVGTSQNTLLGLSIQHKQFNVLASLITTLQEMGIQPTVKLYEEMIFNAAENPENSHEDIRVILNHTIADDFTLEVFKSLVMIGWPIEDLLIRLRNSEVTEITGIALTECMSLINEHNKFDGDEYLQTLVKALIQERLLAEDIISEGVILPLEITMNRPTSDSSVSANESSESGHEGDWDPHFQSTLNPISYSIYANYSKTLKVLLEEYPEEIEQSLDLEADNDAVSVSINDSPSLQKFAILCKSFDSLKVHIECGANPNEISEEDLEEAPDELIEYWKSVCKIVAIDYDRNDIELAINSHPFADEHYKTLLDLIDQYRTATLSDEFLDLINLEDNIIEIIEHYHFLRVISNPSYDLITLALQHIKHDKPKSSKLLITENNRVNIDYTKDPLFCFLNGTYYYLPGNKDEEACVKKTTLRVLTKLTYHITLLKLKSLKDIQPPHSKLMILQSILYRLNSELENRTLSELQRYQEEQETEMGDFFGEDLSDDSDDEQESIFTKNMPMVIRMTKSYASELQELAQVEKLKVTKTPKIKLVGDIPVKKGDLKLMLSHNKGVINREKDDHNRPKFLSAAEIKFEAHKRVINSGTIDLKSLPINKIKIHGHKIKNPAELEAHAQSELDNLNRLCLQGKLEEAIKQVKAPFSIALARGIHYTTDEWTADSRRQHRKADETGKPHFAAAIYQQLKKTITTDLSTLPDDERQQMLAAGKNLAEKLAELKKEGQNPQSAWHMFYAAFQQLYTGKYDDFHQFLEIAMLNDEFSNNSDRMIADKLKSVLFNAKNPHLSAADTPYHALRYALGIKSYPGQFDSRLRPRYRKDGRAERNKTGKVYIYLFTIEEYLQLNPNHVTSMVKAGEIEVISTIRPERETSFFGYIPEGTLVIQYVAKYPSFNKPYQQIYHHKYGLDEVLYNLFKKDFLESVPHSDKRRSIKLLLGEWLCVYHEVRLLREIVQKIKDEGRLLLYHGLEMPFRFSPPDVTTRNNTAAAEERVTNKNPKTTAWTASLTDFFNRGKKLPHVSAEASKNKSAQLTLKL